MKKAIFTVMTSVVIALFPLKGYGDLFGGDLPMLAQLVSNSLEQLAHLQAMLRNGRDNLDLLRQINAGINDSLQLAQTLGPSVDLRLFKDLKEVTDAISKLQGIYGSVVESRDALAQQNSDQAASEALTMGNSMIDYSREIDRIGSEITQFSHQVSPGGAQKLTAQSIGVLLHVMNASLRAQASGLKLQAQRLAQENKKEKDATREYLAASHVLSDALRESAPKFERPRF
jgi:hypothetical protein